MENIRLILFMALAFVLYQLWLAWQADYGQPAVVETVATEAPVLPQVPAPVLPATPQESSVPEAPSRSADVPRTAIAPARSGQRVRITTDLLEVEIDTAGGDIRSANLRAYPVTLEEPELAFPLLLEQPGNIFIVQSGLLGQVAAPNHHAEYRVDRQEYQLAEGQEQLNVPMVWTAEDGSRVTKTYVFHRDSYQVEIHYQVVNAGSEPWSGRLYAQLQRSRPADDEKQTFIYTYTGAVLHSDENRYDKIDFDDMESAEVTRSEQGGWVAMIQHYFGAAVIPDQEVRNHLFAKQLPNGQFASGVVAPGISIDPGASGELSIKLFIGPKEQHRLSAAAPGLELLVDYGVLTILAQPLYWLLEKIHSVVNNWGWSIIFLTMLIKLAFFKLSAASYTSMANMRKLQPRLQQLKERYGDDRQRMNQAMMDMYKKEKINPLGGCLPILVQIPVFISLYWVLLESVELRQAAWIFWIDDLATHDRYFVLPILMGITMLLQQKLNPAPMDPIQAKVMMILPIVFTILFLFFPSGLVLYWFVNNTLSIIQQWIITRRIERGASG